MSLNISVHTRSDLRPVRPCKAASGTAPMPACRVAPSGHPRADGAADRDRRLVRRPGTWVPRGSSTSTSRSISAQGITPSPKVNGIRGLAWAITAPPVRRTASIAAGSTLTSVPSETCPSWGSEVCSTTRSGAMLRRNRAGTIESRDGT